MFIDKMATSTLTTSMIIGIVLSMFFLGAVGMFIVLGWLARLDSRYNNILQGFKKKQQHSDCYNQIVQMVSNLNDIEKANLCEVIIGSPIKIIFAISNGQSSIDVISRDSITYEQLGQMEEQKKPIDYAG